MPGDPLMSLPWWIDYLDARMRSDPPPAHDPVRPLAHALLDIFTEAQAVLLLIESADPAAAGSTVPGLAQRIRRLIGK